MGTTTTIAEFRQQILDKAQACIGLEAYCAYLRHATRDDKYRGLLTPSKRLSNRTKMA